MTTLILWINRMLCKLTGLHPRPDDYSIMDPPFKVYHCKYCGKDFDL